MAKTTPIEAMWSKLGGTKLREYYRVRKKRHELSLKSLGETMGFKDKGQATSIKNLIDGNTRFTPETIQKLSKVLSEHQIICGEDSRTFQTSAKIESIFSTFSGHQMPSLVQDLSNNDLSISLNLIAEYSLLILTLVQFQEKENDLAHAAWRLAQKEISCVIHGWIEISNLINALLPAARDHESQEQFEQYRFNELSSLWNMIDENISNLNIPLQTAYANVLWAQALSWGGNTQFAESHAERSLSLLNHVRMSDEIAFLKYHTYILIGDSKRARGQIRLALDYYELADESIREGSGDTAFLEGILFKKINTYLLANVFPPKWLIEKIRYLSDEAQVESTKAKAFYALAWFERSRHDDGLQSSIKYSVKGLKSAIKSSDHRVIANGHQYLGDGYLQLGNFQLALEHLNESTLLHLRSQSGRIGYSKLLLGLVQQYSAMKEYELLDIPEYKKKRNRAMELFQESENLFREISRYQESGSGAYQLKRLLIEISKWKSIHAVVQTSFESDKQISLAHEFFSSEIEVARHRLDSARALLWLTTKDLFEETIRVTGLFLDYLDWIVLHQDDIHGAQKIDEELSDLLNGLGVISRRVDGNSSGFINFEKSSFGNLSALHAIRGVIRFHMELDGTFAADNDFEKSIYYGTRYNFLALLDCRIIILLGLGLDLTKLVFDNHLKIYDKEKLERYLGNNIR